MTRRRNPQMTGSTIPVQNKTMAEIAAGYGCPEVAVDAVATLDDCEETVTSATQPIPVLTLLEEITRSADADRS